MTIHDLHFLAHPERTSAEIRRDYPALVREHAHRAARIVVPSQLHRGRSRATAGRLRRTHRGVSTGCAGLAAARQRRRRTATFCSSAPRAEKKRRRAARRIRAPDRQPVVKRRSLVLAGQATDEARPWLERLARPPLAGRVRHIGYVDPSNRQALYSGARLLVMPSFDEGFGIPVLEAMTLGVPVVASNRGALPEVLGDAGPLVDPDNPDGNGWRDRPPARRRRLCRRPAPRKACCAHVSSTGHARRGSSMTPIARPSRIARAADPEHADADWYRRARTRRPCHRRRPLPRWPVARMVARQQLRMSSCSTRRRRSPSRSMRAAFARGSSPARPERGGSRCSCRRAWLAITSTCFLHPPTPRRFGSPCHRGDDSRRLVRRPPRVVSRARRHCVGAG